MTQPFIDTFLTEIRKRGFVKPNRFIAFIRPNQYVAQNYLGYGGASLAISQRLALTCFSASIPSISMMSSEFGISSPSRLIPYAKTTNNQSGAALEFYCLGDMFEKEVFHKWIDGIINPTTKEVDYYDNYTKGSEIDLIVVPNIVKTYDQIVEFVANPTMNRVLTGFTFTEVYPYIYTYNSGSVNYQPNTSPTTVKVDFMFREILPFGSLPPSRIEIPEDTAINPFRKEIKEYTLEEARRDFAEAQRRELNIQYENNIQRALFSALSFVQQGIGLL